jgi:hypothetical protein
MAEIPVCTGVCVEDLVEKQNKTALFKVTEPSSVPYRTPACAKMAAYPDPVCVEDLVEKQKVGITEIVLVQRTSEIFDPGFPPLRAFFKSYTMQ